MTATSGDEAGREQSGSVHMSLEDLTRQERVVAEAARTGASASAIAESLFLSTRTVETHLGAVYRKLGVNSRASLVAFLFSHDTTLDDAHTVAKPDPLPHELAPVENFVGRQAEQHILLQALTDAKAGKAVAVVIGGEAGVGKSALVAQLALQAREDGFRVLAGTCDSDFRAAFAPLIDAIRPFLAADPVSAVAGLGPGAGFLATLVPELADLLPPKPAVEDSGTARRMLIEAFMALFAAATHAAPGLLIVEDLQWADQATLGMFRRLVESHGVPSLAVVGTFRNTELVREHPLASMLANLWRDASVRRLELTGFTPAETESLIELATGTTLNEPELQRFHDRTGGNPFFVAQLLRESHTAADGRSALGTASSLPRSVREIVVDRAARLGGDCMGVLQSAAVFGQEFATRALSHASEIAFDERRLTELARSLGRAEAAGLITDHGAAEGCYRFSHDLVREAVLGELTPVELAQAHRRAGRALVALSADHDPTQLVALATHFGAAASLGDGAIAAQFALQAARDAAESFAPDDAIARAEQGIAYLDQAEEDDRLRLDLLLVVIDAHATRMDLSAHRDATLEAVAVARRIGTPLALAQTVDRNTVLPVMGVIDEELLAVKLEAIAALGDEPSPLRTRLLVSASYQRTIGGHGWAAADQAELAVSDSRMLEDPDSMIASLYALAAASAGKPDRDDQLAVVNELIGLSSKRLGRVPEQDGRRFRALLRLAGGDRTGFEHDLAGMSEFAAASGSVFVQSLVGEWRAMLTLLDGDLASAEEHANAVLAVAGDDPNFQLGWLVQLIQIRLEQGRTAEARGMADMALAQSPGLLAIRSLAASVRLQAGDPAGAREPVSAVLSDGVTDIPEDWLRPATLAYLTPAVCAFGAPDQQLTLARLLEPYAGQLLIAGAGAVVLGAADHLRATLLLAAGDGHRAAAVGLLGDAVALTEGCGAVLLAEKSRAALAQEFGQTT
ncbi:MAG: AAA family ATPase [Microbacteriaceae bacterium]